MKRIRLIAVLMGFTAIAALSSPAHARLYQMMRGSNVYPGVATPVPPAAGNFGVPHVGVNVYPSVPAPMRHRDGPNLYQYVRSSPINRLDPTGQESETGTGIYHARGWPKAGGGKGSVFGSKPYRHTIISYTGNVGDGSGADFGPADPSHRQNILEHCGNFWGGSCPGASTAPKVLMPLDPGKPFGKEELRMRKRSLFERNPKLDAGPKKGKSCCEVELAGNRGIEQIKSCIKAVSGTYNNQPFKAVWGPNCMDFAEDAEKKCCLKPGSRHIGWTDKYD